MATKEPLPISSADMSPPEYHVDMGNSSAKPASDALDRHVRMAEDTYVENFRPTTPGHSPGVGH